MAAVSVYLRHGVDGNGDEWYGHWCPGCECAHVFYVGRGKRPCWTFDGNLEKPTFSPSMRSFLHANPEAGEPNERTLCHYFLTAGVINFLSDSSDHELRGLVPLPPFPSDYKLD